jgi:hypothetical protein
MSGSQQTPPWEESGFEPSVPRMASTGTRLLTLDHEELVGRGFGPPDLALAARKLAHAGVAVGVSSRTRNGPFVQSRTNSISNQPWSIMTPAIANAMAASVPGRTRTQQSAFTANPMRRGSTTISLAPLALASATFVAAASREVLGLWPQSNIQPAWS